MRTHEATCDFCGQAVEIREFGFYGGAPNSVDVKAKTVALRAGGDGQVDYYRDFCDEYCLRDYLVRHLKGSRKTRQGAE